MRACGQRIAYGLLRHASSESIRSSELHSGHIFLQRGLYCEVRSTRPAGHGRATAGGYEVKYRELHNRKAREMKLKEVRKGFEEPLTAFFILFPMLMASYWLFRWQSDSVVVIDCDRVSMPILRKDDERMILADEQYNEAVDVEGNRLNRLSLTDCGLRRLRSRCSSWGMCGSSWSREPRRHCFQKAFISVFLEPLSNWIRASSELQRAQKPRALWP